MYVSIYTDSLTSSLYFFLSSHPSHLNMHSFHLLGACLHAGLCPQGTTADSAALLYSPLAAGPLHAAELPAAVPGVHLSPTTCEELSFSDAIIC